MSIKKIKEFAFHLSTFRNIDLLNQGLYQIRIRVYTKISQIDYTQYLIIIQIRKKWKKF